jgi:hypothetical protein
MMTGVNMVHVPYRGSLAVFTDLIKVQVTFQTTAASMAHVRARHTARAGGHDCNSLRSLAGPAECKRIRSRI